MTMEEIYAEQAKIDRLVLENAEREARYKAINDAIQTMFAVHNAQLKALVYAGLNPNFCKPSSDGEKL
jgi:hypothetical protein